MDCPRRWNPARSLACSPWLTDEELDQIDADPTLRADFDDRAKIALKLVRDPRLGPEVRDEFNRRCASRIRRKIEARTNHNAGHDEHHDAT